MNDQQIQKYSLAEKVQLLELARLTIEQATRTGNLPAVNISSLSPRLLEPKAAFVTLHKHNSLRGCIGHLEARFPLYKTVMENARNAALHDYRFSPVKPEELPEITIEISILSHLTPLNVDSPQQLLQILEKERYGVVFQLGPYKATFLPQVWDQLPQPKSFLEHLVIKAGLEPDAWTKPEAQFFIYTVESFSEIDPEVVAFKSQHNNFI